MTRKPFVKLMRLFPLCCSVLRPWSNLWLLGAIAVSFLLHFFILYVPFAALMFSVVGLNFAEWQAVIWLSFPVRAFADL